MKDKRVPQRTCIACRTCKDKKELCRIVRSPEGTFSLDRTGKANGRGAYICNSPECFAKCVKTKALNRVFKTEVPVDVYDALRAEFENG